MMLPCAALALASLLFSTYPATAFSPLASRPSSRWPASFCGRGNMNMASHRPSHGTSVNKSTQHVDNTSLHLSSAANDMKWQPGTVPLQLSPSDLCVAKEGRPRLAKDEAYAEAVLVAWRAEADERKGDSRSDDVESMCAPLVYRSEADGEGSELHGYIYRKSIPSSTEASSASEVSVPGIILFHTGAGPQDLFLRWKADSLVHQQTVFGEEGCVVLIADILGDAAGWAWHDREKYNNVRTSLLVPDANGERKKLAGRVRAAIDTLADQPGVDPHRVAAMGYCLGGHPIVELARMRDPRVRAMATFHGVFDGVRSLSTIATGSEERMDDSTTDCRVLVCTGNDDPFVPMEDLDAAVKLFGDLGYQTKMMRFERTKHGFTNPAQDYNPSPAFGYSAEAGPRAWEAALDSLKGAVGS